MLTYAIVFIINLVLSTMAYILSCRLIDIDGTCLEQDFVFFVIIVAFIVSSLYCVGTIFICLGIIAILLTKTIERNHSKIEKILKGKNYE